MNGKQYIGSILHIRANSVFSRPDYQYIDGKNTSSWRKPPKINKSTGLSMSTNSKRKIKRSAEWLRQSGKLVNRHLGFITLTYSSRERKVKDSFIKKKLLKTFIKRMHYNVGAFQYLWRLEKHKNGNTHIHILVDKFIDWKIINKHWNKLLHKNHLATNYLSSHGTIYANSTDVRSIKGKKQVAAYISKYIAKGGKDRRILGRMWGRSYTLSKACKARLYISVDKEDPILDKLEKLRTYVVEHDDYVIGNLYSFKNKKKLPDLIKRKINSIMWSFRHEYTLFETPT